MSSIQAEDLTAHQHMPNAHRKRSAEGLHRRAESVTSEAFEEEFRQVGIAGMLNNAKRMFNVDIMPDSKQPDDRDQEEDEYSENMEDQAHDSDHEQFSRVITQQRHAEPSAGLPCQPADGFKVPALPYPARAGNVANMFKSIEVQKLPPAGQPFQYQQRQRVPLSNVRENEMNQRSNGFTGTAERPTSVELQHGEEERKALNSTRPDAAVDANHREPENKHLGSDAPSEFSDDAPGDQLVQKVSSTKRGHELTDLDYGVDDLKKISYDELSTQGFDVDPNMPQSNQMLSASESLPNSIIKTDAETFDDKLSSLHTMSDDAAASLFSSSTTSQTEQTAYWFLTQFNTHTKRLMNIRLEKRKVSLKFENEVRKRHAAVKAESDRQEELLKTLGSGGRDLLRNRTPGRQSVARSIRTGSEPVDGEGTPSKRLK